MIGLPPRIAALVSIGSLIAAFAWNHWGNGPAVAVRKNSTEEPSDALRRARRRKARASRPDVESLEARHLLSADPAMGLFQQTKPVFDAARQELAAYLPANDVLGHDFTRASLDAPSHTLTMNGDVSVGGRAMEMGATLDTNTGKVTLVDVHYASQPRTMVGFAANAVGGWDLVGQQTYYPDYRKPVDQLGLSGTSQEVDRLLTYVDSNTRMYPETYSEIEKAGPITIVSNASPEIFHSVVQWVSVMFVDMRPDIRQGLDEFAARIGGIIDVVVDAADYWKPTAYEAPEETIFGPWGPWGGVTEMALGVAISLAYASPLTAAYVSMHEVTHLIQGVALLDNVWLWAAEEDLFHSVIAAGLYPDVYANKNSLEYMAEIVPFAFGAPGIYSAGDIDALKNPDTFRLYDSRGAELVDEIFHASKTPLRPDLVDAAFQSDDAVLATIDQALEQLIAPRRKLRITIAGKQTFDDRIQFTLTATAKRLGPVTFTLDAYYPRGQYDAYRTDVITINGQQIVLREALASRFNRRSVTANGTSLNDLTASGDWWNLGMMINSALSSVPPAKPARHAKHGHAPRHLRAVHHRAGTAYSFAFLTVWPMLPEDIRLFSTVAVITIALTLNRLGQLNVKSALATGIGRAIATVAFLVTLPITFVLVVMVWMTAPMKNPIFVQKRIGYKGRKIIIVKPRTMEGKDVTHMGKWMRALMLDELSQFFLVAIGQMVWFAPRPPQIGQIDKDFEEAIFGRVPPGLFSTLALTGRNGSVAHQWPKNALKICLRDLERASFTFHTWLVIRTLAILPFGLWQTYFRPIRLAKETSSIEGRQVVNGTPLRPVVHLKQFGLAVLSQA